MFWGFYIISFCTFCNVQIFPNYLQGLLCTFLLFRVLDPTHNLLTPKVTFVAYTLIGLVRPPLFQVHMALICIFLNIFFYSFSSSPKWCKNLPKWENRTNGWNLYWKPTSSGAKRVSRAKVSNYSTHFGESSSQ
jgi:energy-coupling factor transporter transmembrane protein EcfT